MFWVMLMIPVFLQKSCTDLPFFLEALRSMRPELAGQDLFYHGKRTTLQFFNVSSSRKKLGLAPHKR